MGRLTVVTRGQYQYLAKYRDLNTTTAPRTTQQLRELATGSLKGDRHRSSTPLNFEGLLLPAQTEAELRPIDYQDTDCQDELSATGPIRTPSPQQIPLPCGHLRVVK